MEIQSRVLSAIDYGADGRFDESLNAICPALEATARKKLGKHKVTRHDYIGFLRKYYWLIEFFIGEGMNLVETKFPSMKIETDNGKTIEAPDLAEIVYHQYRCALAHGFDIPATFKLVKTVEPGRHVWKIRLNGSQLNAPEATLWALIAVVVFCDANSDLTTETDHFLTWGGGPRAIYKFPIKDHWGEEAMLASFLSQFDRIRVKLDFQPSE